MIKFFASLFGYAVNFIYSLIGNYGVAIIIFSILLKLLQLPLSIKQQRSMKKTEKIQKELAVIKEKNKNNPEKLNQEMMALYKRENMSPFSGCFSGIVQIILILAMFSLVRNPLTYMLKIPNEKINIITQYIKEEEKEQISATYPQISILKYVNNKNENIEIKQEEKIEELNINEMKINMNFVGLDLSDIPQQNSNNWKVFIIPVLYVISSIISLKLTTNKKKENKAEEIKEEKLEDESDMAKQMTKSMGLTMPILAVSVSLIAPLGLALYWLTNNILMIFERIAINRFFIDKEEEENKNA